MSSQDLRQGEALLTSRPVDGRDGTAASELVPLLSDYLDDVARRAHKQLGDVAGVSITLSLDGEPWTVGASTALAAEVDSVQYSIGTGPCLTALRDGVGLYVPDLGHDDRWGEYGPRAAALGAASCVSVPVFTSGGDRPGAALKVYADRVDGLSDEQRSLAQTAAVEVAGGIGLACHLARQARLLDDREAAMNTRRTIDLALGVLMERTHSDPETAFQSLRTVSQNYNVKLRDAAREVLATLPDAGPAKDAAPFNNRTKPAR
ncbi:MAG: GAF and ANTAR domain-containing protein [Mycobacterium sp.]